jgi:hypothetical protein
MNLEQRIVLVAVFAVGAVISLLLSGCQAPEPHYTHLTCMTDQQCENGVD